MQMAANPGAWQMMGAGAIPPGTMHANGETSVSQFAFLRYSSKFRPVWRT